jgi:hypothetical protein
MSAFLAFFAGLCFLVSGIIYNYLGLSGEPLYLIPGILLSVASGLWFAIGLDELY